MFYLNPGVVLRILFRDIQFYNIMMLINAEPHVDFRTTYLKGWIVPHRAEYGLFQIRTMEVESWLRRLPLAKNSYRFRL
jgi:hypothetical protein